MPLTDDTPIFWPYDEVTLTAGSRAGEFVVDCPWVNMTVTLSGDDGERASALAEKFRTGAVGPDDLGELNWFFRSLAKYPLCYILPRAAWGEGLDDFPIRDGALLGVGPDRFLAAALKDVPHPADVEVVAGHALFRGEWKWDAEGAIRFSRSPGGIDPRSLFGVSRRYHLLSTLENDETEALYRQVRELARTDRSRFERTAALMLRQNHYVTDRCQSSLEPALAIAQGARDRVRAFMDDERGHDRLLGTALRSLGREPESVPVTSYSKVLMDLLRLAAGRNFLAFALVVDFFERSAYQDTDPFAQVLEAGGLTDAARQINRHMKINDAGEHENMGLGFLATMGPVRADYAEEALRIAEATSNVINLISTGVREMA